LETAKGLRIGSTSGDILNQYPNSTVGYSESGEYTEINGISYFFASNWENTVGNYSTDGISKILNITIPIRMICIGDWGNIPTDYDEYED